MLVRELGEHFGQPGFGEFFYFIGHAEIRLVEFDHARKIDRSGDQHEIAGSAADRFLQFVPLNSAVTMAGNRFVRCG